MGIPGKILIVDDEADALENCRRILSRVPYDCVLASDSRQALDLLDREQPGLVLTDLRMPNFDGIEVLAARAAGAQRAVARLSHLFPQRR